MPFLLFWLGVGITYLGVIVAIFENLGSGLLVTGVGLLFCAVSYFSEE